MMILMRAGNGLLVKVGRQLCGGLRRLADARIFVDRVIHEKLEVVLIGMTVLKKFKVTQFNGKMSIESP
jgi:hypothetical protein